VVAVQIWPYRFCWRQVLHLLRVAGGLDWVGDQAGSLLKRLGGLLGKLEVKETSRPSPPRHMNGFSDTAIN
jgi:hypothetical protein